MPRRRDRHARGFRGPLVNRSPLTGGFMPLRRPASKAQFFVDAVSDSVSRIQHRAPDVLTGVDIGVEQVPYEAQLWDGEQVPLAAAIDATDRRNAQIVIYRSPLEHRASSRPQLAQLVHIALVEQLAALTGRSVDDIDPTIYDEGL